MNNNIWEMKQKEKVCCLDIDGVLLSDYPNCWIKFVNDKMNTDFTNLNELKSKVSYDDYRNLKEVYRLSGIKETFKADIYATYVTNRLKALDYTIIIMTARPASKYPTLYTQTINWLKSNKIVYDLIYFGEKDKHAKILSEIPQMKFMVEDNSYIANQVASWGYKVFLISNDYNCNLRLHKNVVRVNSLKEVGDLVNE